MNFLGSVSSRKRFSHAMWAQWNTWRRTMLRRWAAVSCATRAGAPRGSSPCSTQSDAKKRSAAVSADACTYLSHSWRAWHYASLGNIMTVTIFHLQSDEIKASLDFLFLCNGEEMRSKILSHPRIFWKKRYRTVWLRRPLLTARDNFMISKMTIYIRSSPVSWTQQVSNTRTTSYIALPNPSLST